MSADTPHFRLRGWRFPTDLEVARVKIRDLEDAEAAFRANGELGTSKVIDMRKIADASSAPETRAREGRDGS
jgi:hypothetical protein